MGTTTAAQLMSEGLISMKHAAQLVRCGMSKSTTLRWHLKGATVNGRVIKLDACRVGAAYYTSAAAVARFVEAQNSPPPDSPEIQAPAPRNRAAAKATAQVASLLGAA